MSPLSLLPLPWNSRSEIIIERPFDATVLHFLWSAPTFHGCSIRLWTHQTPQKCYLSEISRVIVQPGAPTIMTPVSLNTWTPESISTRKLFVTAMLGTESSLFMVSLLFPEPVFFTVNLHVGWMARIMIEKCEDSYADERGLQKCQFWTTMNNNTLIAIILWIWNLLLLPQLPQGH